MTHNVCLRSKNKSFWMDLNDDDPFNYSWKKSKLLLKPVFMISQSTLRNYYMKLSWVQPQNCEAKYFIFHGPLSTLKRYLDAFVSCIWIHCRRQSFIPVNPFMSTMSQNYLSNLSSDHGPSFLYASFAVGMGLRLTNGRSKFILCKMYLSYHHIWYFIIINVISICS